MCLFANLLSDRRWMMNNFILCLIGIQFCLFIIVVSAFYRHLIAQKNALLELNDAVVILDASQKQDVLIFSDFLKRLNVLNDSTYNLGQFLMAKHPDDKRLFSITTNIHKTQAVDDATS